MFTGTFMSTNTFMSMLPSYILTSPKAFSFFTSH